MKRIYYSTIILFFSMVPSTNAFDFYSQLKKGPLIIIHKDKKGAFDSVTAIAMIRASYDTVWNTIIDIDKYKEYMPQVVESKIIKIINGNTLIIAEFEIEVPLRNTVYTLKHFLYYDKKKIDVYQSSGDLKGSHWHWQFQKVSKNRTLVYYTGKTINFSSFLQKFEDKNKSISMGINVASVLETIRLISLQAEKQSDIYKRKR